MKKHFTLALFLFFTTIHFNSNAQVFWTEDFDATACASGCGLPYAGANGNWTQATTGPAGDSPNRYYVSCAENGQAAGICGAGCGSDNSLHVGSDPGILGDLGAAFYSGDGGLGFADGTTNIRAESPIINCTGFTGITLDFNYIENGDAAIDNAQLWYNDGVTWTMISDLSKTTLCPSGQGLWTAFSIALPASADGNPNVRIGFSWVNNNDASGTDPSFAVDDITLSAPSSTPPVAGFTFSPASPCTGATVTFTNTSTGAAPITYSWTFAGGTPATSSAANPTVTFATAGPHTVTLTVTNADGTDTETQTVTVVACTTPVANFTFSPSPICAGSPVTFTNTSSGGPFTSALWSFVGATPATSSSVGSASTTWATPGTYTVQLIVNNASGSDTLTSSVTVINCSTPPNANFTIPAGPFCQGQCITFTNTTTGSTPITYSWNCPGGTPSTSTALSPNICYATAGTYNVTLVATNASGTDSVTQTITINSCVVPPVANFNAPDTICRGQCLNFTDLSSGTPTSWAWAFSGASPSSSTVQNPTTICYNSVGTFTVSLTVSNSSGSSNMTQNIVVVNCSPPSSGFTMNDTRICQGQCITVDNITTFGTTYLWTFPGAEPDSSTLAEPGTICYDSSGAFQITLIAFNAYGSDTTVQNIIVDTIPIIEAFPDEAAVSLGNSIDLWVVANGDVTYEWITTDTASIGDTSLANVTVTPTAPGSIIYYVVATGDNGCSNTDSVLIDVELTDVIALPNAFSPNGDGHNDVLRVLGPGVKGMHLIVYNRYGQLVFESNDQAVGWDGKHNGKQVDPGVFAWYLEYTLDNGLTGKQKGNVTLIR